MLIVNKAEDAISNRQADEAATFLIDLLRVDKEKLKAVVIEHSSDGLSIHIKTTTP